MIDGKYYCCISDFLLKNKDNNSKIFILVGEYSSFHIEELSSYDGEVYGAIVPFIVYNNEYINRGLIACTLADDSEFFFVESLKSMNTSSSVFENKESLVVFLDGLSPNITTFLDDLFELVPENTQIIGGGAGKLTFEEEPVIFSKNKIYQDAAIIIASKSKLKIGIENGWDFLEGPFLATRSEQNILKTLNFRNAFEVYKEIVEKDSGMKFTNDNFFDIAKLYPIGIVKFNREVIVRDPIGIDEFNNMILVGDIPQNSTINILKGDIDKLVKSSGNAVFKVINELKETDNHNIFLFDCISRAIFLGDKFTDEITSIKKNMNKNNNLFGALTIGEIANNGNEYIAFYNKSCVVGALC